MLSRIAHLSVRRRFLILLLATLAFVGAGAGGGVAEHLSSGGFDTPGLESYAAEQALDETFGTDTATWCCWSRPTRAPRSTTRPWPPPGRSSPPNWPPRRAWTTWAATGAWLAGAAEEPHRRLRPGGGPHHRRPGPGGDPGQELTEEFAGSIDGATVSVGGFGPVFAEVGTTIEEDLLRAEMIALPITILLLLLIFRGVVAAALPLAIGALSVVGTFLVLRILSEVTEVSVFALNLTTALGLGLAIDYSLFVVSRYREELAAGFEPNVAVVRTVRTAGRTVAFSALTVAAIRN